MCGIVGCILKNDDDVAPILFDCISKLEYRGYDSIGLATYDENKIHIKKVVKIYLTLTIYKEGWSFFENNYHYIFTYF